MSSPHRSSPQISIEQPLPTAPTSDSPHLASPPSPTSSPAPAPAPTTTTFPHAPTPTSPTSAPPLPPTAFSPFFTLVSSPDSPTSHHPTVHYLFSDDADTDLLTSAALQTLELSASASSAPSAGARSSPGTSDAERSPPPRVDAAPRNRFVVIDLDDSGKRVLAARSMAPDWQVVAAHVEPAPTWEGEGDGKGLLLRVEGVRVGRGGEEDGGEGLEALVEGYMKRLGELRRVVEGGGGEGGGVG